MGLAHGNAFKKLSAQDVMDKRAAAFKKHDKDKDEALNLKELTAFVKEDCKFTLTKEAGERMLKALTPSGGKGVSVDDVFRIRASVGIERERIKDAERKKVRLAREGELEKLKAALVKKIEAV